jgi:hypothetical protein
MRNNDPIIRIQYPPFVTVCIHLSPKHYSRIIR